MEGRRYALSLCFQQRFRQNLWLIQNRIGILYVASGFSLTHCRMGLVLHNPSRYIRRSAMDKNFEDLIVELDGLKIKQEAVSNNTAKTVERLDSIEKTLQAIYDLLKSK
jgi:hypothetical protein